MPLGEQVQSCLMSEPQTTFPVPPGQTTSPLALRHWMSPVHEPCAIHVPHMQLAATHARRYCCVP